MRKKSVFVLLMLLALSSISLVFAGCDYTTGEIGRIDYDNESKTIFWESVAGADNYTVFENGKRLLNTNDTKFPVSALKEDVSYITVAPTKYMKDTGLSEEYLFVTKGSEGVKYNLQEKEYHAIYNEKAPEGTVINVQSVFDGLPVTEVLIFNDYESVIPDTVKEFSMGEFPYKTFRIPLNIQEMNSLEVDCESYSVSKFHDLYTVQDGILYNKDLTKLISYPTLKKDIKYIMPNSVVEIKAWGIYSETPYLKELILSNNLINVDIGSIAATGVMDLIIPAKVKLTDLCIVFCGKKLILEEGIVELYKRSITLAGVTFSNDVTVGNNNCDVFLPKSLLKIADTGIVNNKENKDLKITLHCAANEKPAGWHESWQKGCEVIWGEKF